MNTIRVSNVLDPDHSVGPALGPNICILGYQQTRKVSAINESLSYNLNF